MKLRLKTKGKRFDIALYIAIGILVTAPLVSPVPVGSAYLILLGFLLLLLFLYKSFHKKP